MGGSRAASQVGWLSHSKGLSCLGKSWPPLGQTGTGLLLGRLVAASLLEGGEDRNSPMFTPCEDECPKGR